MTTHHTSGAADLPEALRLAEWMQNAVVTYPQMSEDEPGGYCQEIDQVMDQAAAELRRLHNESVEAHAGYRTEQYWLGWNAALAAGQAVAQPVRTWCDGCSLENCGGCHIPSNAAAPAQAPNQPGGFSSGDMASAAAQGYRDGWTAAQTVAEPGTAYAAALDTLFGAIMGAAYDFRDAHLSGSGNIKRHAHAELESTVRSALAALLATPTEPPKEQT